MFIQVFFNLFYNAYKFRGPGKNLNVRVKQHQSNNGFELLIEDQGLASPEKFAFPSDLNPNSSQGSDLFVTRKIVEAHGGRLEIQQRDPTQIKIWLPVDRLEYKHYEAAFGI